jgi:hypothetical protein
VKEELANQIADADYAPRDGVSHHLAITLTNMGGVPWQQAEEGKVSKADANFIEEGPYPFVCGNCKFIVWGPSRNGDPDPSNLDDGADLCQIVDGEIHPDNACRFFHPKPNEAHEEWEHESGGGGIVMAEPKVGLDAE